MAKTLLNYVLLSLLGYIATQDSNCDFFQNVQLGQPYYVNSTNYPRNYTPGITCRWIARCPEGYNCRADCYDILIPQSTDCSVDRLLISKTGDPSLAGAEVYCGSGSTIAVSRERQLSFGLLSRSKKSGRFMCKLTAEPANPPAEDCRCGYKKTNRIVGGVETDENEFPAMAAVYDVDIYQIKCGGVIIAANYVLTAAHCLLNRNNTNTAVVVGEHDVTSNNDDSPARQILKISRLQKHPQFDPDTYDYDLGMIKTATEIVFSNLVGPVCLPFKFSSNSFAGSKVTIAGWGTLSPGGQTSDALRKVDLDVIKQSACQQQMSNVSPRQMCTFTRGKDACQDDSGGPLFYTDQSTGLYFVVGIISHGKFCASDTPGMNTRVTALLNWIVSITPDVQYCKK